MGGMADYYADLALNSQFDTSKMAKEAYDNYERGLLTWKTKSGDGKLEQSFTSAKLKHHSLTIGKKQS
jgi:hypothetical protein